MQSKDCTWINLDNTHKNKLELNGFFGAVVIASGMLSRGA